MKTKLLVVASLLLSCVVARAESQAQDALSSIIYRYRSTKFLAPDQAREISLACSGEILSEYVLAYLGVIESQHLNTSLIHDYQEAVDLVQANKGDIENTYQRLRANLIEAINALIAAKRNAGTLAKVPNMTIQDFGESQMNQDFAICDDPTFIAAVAQLAPLTGSYNDEVEGTYRIPLGNNDGGDFSPKNGVPEKVVKGKLPIKTWLYKIYIR